MNYLKVIASTVIFDALVFGRFPDRRCRVVDQVSDALSLSCVEVMPLSHGGLYWTVMSFAIIPQMAVRTEWADSVRKRGPVLCHRDQNAEQAFDGKSANVSLPDCFSLTWTGPCRL